MKEAGGNPFFVELLSSALVDAQSGFSGSQLDSSVDEDSQPPLTLSYIFRRRLKQLPKTARRLLAILAVSDEVLPVQVAWTAASVGQEGQRAISTLKADSYIRTRQFDGVDFCEIYHERIRDALLAELTPKQVHRLKNELSNVLAQQGSILSQSLFDHYISEGAIERARDFAVESGASRQSICFRTCRSIIRTSS